MKHYFSSYFDKLDKQEKKTKIALTLSVFGILLFLVVALSIPFQDTLFRSLFPKGQTQATQTAVAFEVESGSINDTTIITLPGNDLLASGNGNNFVRFTKEGLATSPTTPPTNTPVPPTATKTPTNAPTSAPTATKAPTPTPTNVPPTSGTKLRWAPPTLTNPTTIQLGTGPTTTVMDTKKDYIIKMPATKKSGMTKLQGGRNVVLVGGHVTVAPNLPICYHPNCTNEINRAIFITGATGTVHIEGLLIDSSSGSEMDAVIISAPQAIVQLQNIRVNNLRGTYERYHADMIQPWGGVKELRIDRFTGDTNYQAFYFVYNSIQKVVMQNTNVKHNGGEGKLLYMSSTSGCSSHPGSVSFSNVYFQPRPGSSLPNEVVPDSRSSCKPTFSNGTLTFPLASWVTGSIRQGAPATDFVPSGVVGTNYVSPGYQSTLGATIQAETQSCPSLPTTTGKITKTITIPSSGMYTIWSRIKAQNNASNSYYLQVDDNCGVVVGNLEAENGFPMNQWTWVDYRDGTTNGTATKIQLELAAGEHTITMVGREENLHLDRILLTRDGCIPTDKGDNCLATPTPQVGEKIPAADGEISAPFTINNSLVSQPAHTQENPSQGGRAAYSFNVKEDGAYVVKMRVNAPTTSSNSFFVNIDQEPTDPVMVWDIPITSGIEERTLSWRGSGTVEQNEFSPKVFTLAKGDHTLIIRGREQNTQIESVTIEKAPIPADITFEAESGTITTPFVSSNGSISQRSNTTDPARGGKAVYNFTVSVPGKYIVKTLTNAASTGSNSLYITMDSEPDDDTQIWDIPLTSGFEERTVAWRGSGTVDNNEFSPKIFTLNTGNHELVIRGRERNTYVDKITIEYAGTDTSVPTILPVTSAPTNAPTNLPTATKAPTSVPTTAPGGPGAKLRWAPPTLTNPTTIQLGTGPGTITMDTTRDYILKMPAQKRIGNIHLKGGRNVVLIGGRTQIQTDLPACSHPNCGNPWRAFMIEGATGTVHIEGVQIDGTKDIEPFAISAPKATVQLQNIRVDNAQGDVDTQHSDIVQPWGGVKELRIDRMTGSTNYQVFYFVYSSIGPVKVQNANFVQFAGPNRPDMMYTSGNSSCTPHPTSVDFTNVYMQPVSGSLGRALTPGTDRPAGCLAQQSGNVVTWPGVSWLTGSIMQGLPPSGDFVPTGTAGLNYQTPGYQ